MNAWAIIPARSGSKGIPDKNIKDFCGVPLIVRSIRAALDASSVSRVIVSTDSECYASLCRQAGGRVVMRPADLASDTSSSESALIHVLETFKDEGEDLPEWIVFMQCTSPLTRGEDIDGLLETAYGSEADTALTVVASHRFLWHTRPDGHAYGINHEKNVRLRRQDREPEFMENGAAYAMRTDGFLKHRHRFFGKTVLYQLPDHHAIEIDSSEDWMIAEAIYKANVHSMRSERLPENPALLVFDFDGVFTDNRVMVSEDGTESVFCDRGDGMGLEWLRQAGIPCMILSKEENPVVTARAKKVRLPVEQAVEKKAEFLEKHCRERKIPLAQVVYVGNDLNDLECMRLVGCGVAVGDAVPEILQIASIRLKRPGGRGAIRELAEMILRKTNQ